MAARIRQQQTQSAAKSEALTIEIQGVSRDCKLVEQKNAQLEIALKAARLAEQRAEEIDARTKRALEYYRSLCGMHGTSGKALANDHDHQIGSEDLTGLLKSGNSACPARYLRRKEPGLHFISESLKPMAFCG